MSEETPKTPHRSKLVTFIDIVSVRLRFILLMVIVGVVAAKWETMMNYYDRWTRPATTAEVAHSGESEYYCAMHPNIIRDEPGKCPVCGMPLSKRAKSTSRPAMPDGVLAQVQLTPLKVEMGRIGTSPVDYRLLTREIRSVGIVDYDETRRAFITSRIKGRLDRLLVNFVGQKVKKGDALAEIYSPDLLVAQEELLSASRSLKEQKDNSPAAEASRAVVDASRKKLALWGFTEPQIDDVIKKGTPQTEMTILSPIAGIVTEKKILEGKYVMEGEDLYTIADLGNVWMQAKIFESEIKGIAEGTAVEVTTTAYPNEVFAGKITFIAYSVDPDTRTISARVEVANPEYKLRPGMYVVASIRLSVGKVIEIPGGPTTRPVESAADTRELARAYLAVAGAFASDKTDDASLAKLTDESAKLAKASPDLAGVAKLAAQTQLMAGKPLDAQRETFKLVSDALIKVLQIAPPRDLPLFTAHCPMVKADWITDKKEILNPYAGSDMLTCGSITGPLAAPAVGDDSRFVTGYYCPVTPDRLFDKPEHCPVEKFGTRYVRIEKVLALPESAVIDTGAHKVVYRETNSGTGTFDMVEVKVGKRAGEFFPVYEGLKPGDVVATQGAFLVDAENRLNPASAVQYLGAAAPKK
ncbi:MAG: efflux RND transporter periplasmic adaptor subunit [Tepidisphaerales bacterium]